MPVFDDLFAAYDRPDAPGAAALVLHRGEIIAQAAYGAADLRTGRLCLPSTCFRLASVSKQITAAAILLLIEAGDLALDTTIGQFVPGLPGYAHAVTIRQLLTHSSGLADYENCIPADHPTQIQDAQVPALLPADPQHGLFFVPGAGYRYSNTGYVLLALIAARVAGMPFPALLQQRIFAPLGMASSLAYCADGPPVPERAYGHTWDGSTWQCTDQSSTSATLGDGGIYASARDLARWLAALEEGLLLQPASLRAAITPWIATDDGRHYGFGWFIGEHRGGALVHHDGTTVGFRTAIVRLPERRRAAIVLTNRTHADPTRLALALLDRS